MLFFGIGKGFVTNLLFTSQKLLRKHTVLFFFGIINDGKAHSDACCLWISRQLQKKMNKMNISTALHEGTGTWVI